MKERKRYVSEVKAEFQQIPEISIGQFCDICGTRIPHNRRLILIFDMMGQSDMAKAVFHSDLNVKVFNLQGEFLKFKVTRGQKRVRRRNF